MIGWGRGVEATRSGEQEVGEVAGAAGPWRMCEPPVRAASSMSRSVRRPNLAPDPHIGVSAHPTFVTYAHFS